MNDTRAFLFTDIEESTRRWEARPAQMEIALRRHDAILRRIAGEGSGNVFKTIGDAFCVAFARAHDAVHAALDIQLALKGEDFSAIDGLHVRMAIHAGAVEARDGDYFGPTLNRVARLLATGYGDQILLSTVAAELARPYLRAEATLRDLGSHRLKDLPFSERVYQAVLPQIDREFAPIKSLDRYWSNVPVAATHFVGRERERLELATHLETARELTIVGPGGVGKTRLAMQLGTDALPNFPDGVWFVELAAIGDAPLVADAIAATLGVRVGASERAVETIVHAMQQRDALIILDNCEHVLPAVADVVAALVRTCRGVRTVATSRQALEIEGECVHRIDPLPCPSPLAGSNVATARTYAAVALFEERARAALAAFALTEANVAYVVEIVNRLDGIALAIELAAPRIVALSPKQLAQRLDERFRLLSRGNRDALPRQQTLRALIDWSYDLLSVAERTLFRRLAVFRGGFTLDAACDVCDDAAGACDDVFESLMSLVAKSLVSADLAGDEKRYRLLESTREYAAERLVSSGEDATLALRHARYYGAYVEGQRELWEALDNRLWQRRLVDELDNLRAALRYALVERNDVALALRTLAAIEQPRHIFLPAEALRWYEAARDASRDTNVPEVRAAILRRYAAMITYRRVPLGERITDAEAAVAASEATADPVAIADATQTLCILLRDAGRSVEAQPLMQAAWQSLVVRPALARKVLFCCDWTLIELERGDLEGARRHIGFCLEFARRGSMVFATAQHMLAEVEFAAGAYERARSLARDARLAFLDLDLQLNRGATTSNLAAYALALDDLPGAREALVDALAIVQKAQSSGHLNAVLEHHAVFASLAGDDERAARLLGFTNAQYATLGQVREATETLGYKRLTRRLEDAFDPAGRERLAAAGALLSFDEAIVLALEIQTLRPASEDVVRSTTTNDDAILSPLER